MNIVFHLCPEILQTGPFNTGLCSFWMLSCACFDSDMLAILGLKYVIDRSVAGTSCVYCLALKALLEFALKVAIIYDNVLFKMIKFNIRICRLKWESFLKMSCGTKMLFSDSFIYFQITHNKYFCVLILSAPQFLGLWLLVNDFQIARPWKNCFYDERCFFQWYSFGWVLQYRFRVNCWIKAALHDSVTVCCLTHFPHFTVKGHSLCRRVSVLKCFLTEQRGRGRSIDWTSSSWILRGKWCISSRKLASLGPGILAVEEKGDKSCGIKISWTFETFQGNIIMPPSA